MAAPRYYVIRDQKLRSIVDGSTGQSVDVEPVALVPGETGAARAARMRYQDRRCAALNREDDELRRQLREPHEVFVTRVGQMVS